MQQLVNEYINAAIGKDFTHQYLYGETALTLNCNLSVGQAGKYTTFFPRSRLLLYGKITIKIERSLNGEW